MRQAIYPGTFDPITNGHIDIVRKASNLFDKIYLCIAQTTDKKTLFSIDQRYLMCKDALSGFPNVEVVSFVGLATSFAKKLNVTTIIRGLRAVSDFEYELQLALTNKKMENEIETLFFVPNYKFLYLSSSIVRQVYLNGGSIDGSVPDVVRQSFEQKSSKNLDHQTDV